ncbi:hypothetical protein ACFLZF_00270 [Nanoarchaeota archaeon]
MDKRGQIFYAISVGIILIVFVSFGILIATNYSISSNVISEVDLTSTCDDNEIKQLWDSIFWESSDDIFILKNNTVLGGKCIEYFATKNNSDVVYILYGYSKEDGNRNVTNIIAERLNMTEKYFNDFLNKIEYIENVSALYPSKYDSFFETYVKLRQEVINSTNAEENFNKTFEMNESEIWTSGFFLNNLSYGFSRDLSNDTVDINVEGKISSNYSYSFFNLFYEIVSCEMNIDCDPWSECINDSKNRTCINSSNCYSDIIYEENMSCNAIICEQSWNWSNWSECVNGFKTRSIWDENNCSNNTGIPSNNISCVIEQPDLNETECISDWDCETTPSTCPSSGVRTKTCVDLEGCEEDKTEEITCEQISEEKKTNWVFIFVIFLVVIFILIILFLIIYLIRKKDDTGESLGALGNKSFGSPPSVSGSLNKFVPRKFVRPKTFVPRRVSLRPVQRKFQNLRKPL